MIHEAAIVLNVLEYIKPELCMPSNLNVFRHSMMR